MFQQVLKRIEATSKTWQEVSRQRKELSSFSDDLLKDIGLSRVDADREANRPYWDHKSSCDSTLRRYEERDTYKQNPQGSHLCCSNT